MSYNYEVKDRANIEALAFSYTSQKNNRFNACVCVCKSKKDLWGYLDLKYI